MPFKLSADKISKDLKDIIRYINGRFKKGVLYKLAEYPLEDALSTMLAFRIMPDPRDFQKLALYRIGQKKLAEELDKKNELLFSVKDFTK